MGQITGVLRAALTLGRRTNHNHCHTHRKTVGKDFAPTQINSPASLTLSLPQPAPAKAGIATFCAVTAFGVVLGAPFAALLKSGTTVTASPDLALRARAEILQLASAASASDIAGEPSKAAAATDDAAPRRTPLLTAGLTDIAAAAAVLPRRADRVAPAGDGLEGLAVWAPASAPGVNTSRSVGQARPWHKIEEVIVQPGDTLAGILSRAGLDSREIFAAIEALKPHYNPRRIRAGQAIELVYKMSPQRPEAQTGEAKIILASARGGPLIESDAEADAERDFVELSLRPAVDYSVMVRRDDRGDFIGDRIDHILDERLHRARGVIDSSLYLAAKNADIPDAVIVELIRMYSYDIDFQREIRKGDAFEIFYSYKYDEDGNRVKMGHVAYAAMTNNGETKALFRYTPGDTEETDYFAPDGRSAKKFLMKTPIDGARISSHFGRRKHPVLGYTKMHKGTDFAAPTGTPVYAAGNGVIEHAARYGSFGNYVRIRHADGYQTAYAHLNGFGRGMRAGTRVSQGDVIGYVGTTGRSTGPHLHYEVHRHGKQINPLTIRVPTGRKLEGEEFIRFEKERLALEERMAKMPYNGAELTAQLGTKG